jgi:PAS domain S-box-containing protein
LFSFYYHQSLMQSSYSRYGIALVFVGTALLLSLLLHGVLSDGFLIFFLSAVMLTGWFGRTGPGLFAVFLSMVAAAYYFIPPYRALAVNLEELPYFLSFLLSALVTSWLSSARRDAEERQKAHLDELFEQTPEAILLVDVQDRVLRVNKRFTQMFGYAIQEIAGRHSVELIVPPQLRDAARSARERLAEGQEVSVETIRQAKDGATIDVSEVSFPVIADAKCIAYYTIFRDITSSKRALEDLHKAQSELAHLSRITTMGELASSIAHEINQPIGAIATNGNAAVRWLAQTPPHMEGAGEALDCIIRDVVREVLVLTSYETSRRGATVKTELTSSLPPVLGDRVQLQQVLLNLIINSLDSMNTVNDRPRELVIRSSREANNLALEVMDSGQGWDDQLLDRIFDPFFTTKKDGIGMGLTISRSIVEAHGGRLWAERREPYGAILKFALPIAAGTI